MVSKLLKGLGLQVSCKSFPMVYSWLRRYVDRGKMTYNYYIHRPLHCIKEGTENVIVLEVMTSPLTNQ